MRSALVLLVCLLAAGVLADVYMHNPRGSNNRLHGAGTNADNQNRLFDSQNNAKGGYNQGYMYYYTGSQMTIEWTNQHGAGLHPFLRSELVLQYMCDDSSPDMRDGAVSTTIDTNAPDDFTKGRQETFAYYSECASRQRNMGLFIADRNLGGNRNRAINTRQNEQGTRFGLECPEERDYYPYWHPTPWRDVAILTSNISRCAYYQAESQNVKNKGHCQLNPTQLANYNAALARGNTSGVLPPAAAQFFNNPFACQNANQSFVWTEDGAWNIRAPFCGMPPTTRDNHNGNALNPGRDGSSFQGYASLYNWTIPATVDGSTRKCVLRLRYNVSTGDYDPWNIDASRNGNQSPVRNNPTVNLFNASGFTVDLALNLNTDQVGRTFQDRSHLFDIVPDPGVCRGRVYNLNIRGKRGNIVQVYPAVEYDFVPENLEVQGSDCVHVQWTGSNSNPQGNDGQGVAGSDRNNFVQAGDGLVNYPLYLPNVSMFGSGAQGLDYNSTVRLYATMNTDLPNNQPQLNDAAPYYDGGVLQFSRQGTINYLSTRNNNFSNRSQKGAILVTSNGNWWNAALIIGLCIFGGAVIMGAVVAWAVLGTKHPDSLLGTTWFKTHDFVAGIVSA